MITTHSVVSDTCLQHYIKDRYRELLRAGRLWRTLKHSKWRGSWVDKPPSDPNAEETPPALEEAGTDIPTFCAACPQPGINLPDDWVNDPDQSVYFFHWKLNALT
jgi:hypothetical protein